jgi:hypothetical protein
MVTRAIRSTFLKKRLVSRAFDEVDVRFVVALVGWAMLWGALK